MFPETTFPVPHCEWLTELHPTIIRTKLPPSIRGRRAAFLQPNERIVIAPSIRGQCGDIYRLSGRIAALPVPNSPDGPTYCPWAIGGPPKTQITVTPIPVFRLCFIVSRISSTPRSPISPTMAAICEQDSRRCSAAARISSPETETSF